MMASGYKKDGFIYSAETQAGFPLLTDGETGIEVTVCDLAKHRYATGKYLWDGSKFIFSN